jgi:predicted DNA-binding transcriptional regulator YafY
MKFETAISLLSLLSPDSTQAMSITAIMDKWGNKFDSEIHLRTVQKYMQILSMSNVKDISEKEKALISFKKKGREKYYYLKVSQVAHLFLDHEKALQQILAQQALRNAFGNSPVGRLTMEVSAAEQVADSQSNTSRLRQRVRVVPDGIGRLHAKIDPKILEACFVALGSNKRLEFMYKNAAGQRKNKKVNPLGLVAKDGTVYLVARNDGQDGLTHYPLQRASDMHVSPSQSIETPNFNLDLHIEQTHQFSHQLGPADELITLNLRVHQNTIYHFLERPLVEGQECKEMEDGSWLVKAEVPNTFLLIPFLASFGSWIQVLSPLSIQKGYVEFVHAERFGT